MLNFNKGKTNLPTHRNNLRRNAIVTYSQAITKRAFARENVRSRFMAREKPGFNRDVISDKDVLN